MKILFLNVSEDRGVHKKHSENLLTPSTSDSPSLQGSIQELQQLLQS